MELCHLELELDGCNNEVAALQSDSYTEVPLYMNGFTATRTQSMTKMW